VEFYHFKQTEYLNFRPFYHMILEKMGRLEIECRS
jgi:hypothetical protein